MTERSDNGHVSVLLIMVAVIGFISLYFVGLICIGKLARIEHETHQMCNKQVSVQACQWR